MQAHFLTIPDKVILKNIGFSVMPEFVFIDNDELFDNVIIKITNGNIKYLPLLWFAMPPIWGSLVITRMYSLKDMKEFCKNPRFFSNYKNYEIFTMYIITYGRKEISGHVLTDKIKQIEKLYPQIMEHKYNILFLMNEICNYHNIISDVKKYILDFF